MPITKEAYEKGMYYSSLEEQIQELIKNSPNMAYTVADIVQALDIEKGKGFIEDLLIYMAVQSSLKTLVDNKKIGSRIIRGTAFYSAT
jgi:hypothetical protein